MKHNNIKKTPSNQTALIIWIYNYFNQDVPKITTIPTLQEYNLPDNIHDIVEKENKKIKKFTYIILISLYIIGFIITFGFVLNYQEFDTDIFDAFLEVVFTYGWIAYLILGIFGIPIIESIISKVLKNKETKYFHEQYSKYMDAKYAYIYWEETTKLNYWMSLDGHQFEDAVAATYRANGYNARVSKHGGDGGVDIILEKDGNTIAVQCKAHKKEIGPSVARDFYGTISHFGINEGFLVSRSGFTTGVYDFVKDKPIKLVTLNDLMYAQDSILYDKQSKPSIVTRSPNQILNSNTKLETESSVKKAKNIKKDLPNDDTTQLTFEDIPSFTDNKMTKEKSDASPQPTPQTAISKPKTDLPKIDIGTKVYNKTWGEGTIVVKGVSTFVVNFNGTEIKFTYPLSIQNGTLTIK